MIPEKSILLSQVTVRKKGSSERLNDLPRAFRDTAGSRFLVWCPLLCLLQVNVNFIKSKPFQQGDSDNSIIFLQARFSSSKHDLPPGNALTINNSLEELQSGNGAVRPDLQEGCGRHKAGSEDGVCWSPESIGMKCWALINKEGLTDVLMVCIEISTNSACAAKMKLLCPF